ncbi:hypothetical protein LCGC14_2212030 [marine sediment metagenome]|uniref:Uncharacterized protein n=1 Tax=marine sediment metagenome TaxID=412755 RepID=A0A0F9DDH5_9ZZZZ
MTIAKGDRLVIVRDGKVVEGEGHREFEALENGQYSSDEEHGHVVTIKLKVVQ